MWLSFFSVASVSYINDEMDILIALPGRYRFHPVHVGSKLNSCLCGINAKILTI